VPINLPGRFKDRYDAARRLLPELAGFAVEGASMGRTSGAGPGRTVRKSGGERVDRQGFSDVVVVAIPGGGVQIGAFLARELGRPLDVAVVEAAGGVTVPTSVSGKTVLLVDDGIAPGLAMVATVSALRPARLGSSSWHRSRR
jgi:predicted phosphoribosyltransferase